MREELLGYLLSALEPHEMRRVDQQLQQSAALREELAEVQRTLAGLDRSLAEEKVAEVPPDLVARTLAAIPPRRDDESDAGVLIPVGSAGLGSPLDAVALEPERRAWLSWPDVLFLTLAASALLALMLPLMVRQRDQARSVACQNNLRQLGAAFAQFVLRQRDAHLPALAERGPEAFAGVYAVRLTDAGLLDDPYLRWCPAREMPATELDTPMQWLANTDRHGEPARHPELTHLVIGADLKHAAEVGNVGLLRYLQRIAGGHLAYTLGIEDGNRYDAPQYEGRTSFAILGDAPIAGHHAASAVDVTKMRWSHGEGANLLFEDGSVRHLRLSEMLGVPDHPFVNHRGAMEAGVNVDDASLGPSWRGPYIQTPQR